MTLTGSNVGGSMGGQPTPTPYEIETSAATQAARLALGIVSDSLEHSFTQMTPRYSVGYLGGFGYKSNPNQPLLDHPLENARVLQSFQPPQDALWLPLYEEFIKQLPQDLQQRFLSDSSQPFEQRNPLFVALETVLKAAAKTIDQATTLAQQTDASGLENTRKALNLQLPLVALKGSLLTGNEIGDSALERVNSLGANTPYFDSLHGVLKEMEQSLSLLSQLDGSLGGSKESSDIEDSTTLANTATLRLFSLRDSLAAVSLGNDLQILQPTCQALATVAASLAFKEPGTSALFLGLSIALISIKTTDSPTLGMIGPSIGALLDVAMQGLVGAVMPKSTPADRQLLGLSVFATVAVAIGCTAWAIDVGLKQLPSSANDEERLFVFETALHFLESTNAMQTLFKELFSLSTDDARATRLGSAMFAQLTHLLMMLAATSDGDKIQTMIETGKEYIKKGVRAAEEAEGEMFPTPQLAASAIAFKQSLLALEDQDYGAFFPSLDIALESLRIKRQGIVDDLKTLKEEALRLLALIEGRDQYLSLTGITTIA